MVKSKFRCCSLLSCKHSISISFAYSFSLVCVHIVKLFIIFLFFHVGVISLLFLEKNGRIPSSLNLKYCRIYCNEIREQITTTLTAILEIYVKPLAIKVRYSMFPSKKKMIQ
ncbi:hypothetical protein Pint_12181 [Pistacia integerrima]|uniref:Uncharacterized protein n=1 Tax=Pistacia integerrima TaxID=434235 RepID=A0ACC0XI36_9ROSI|nr:hypothetical protein Pint_12181 [Pistacia integerrima]